MKPDFIIVLSAKLAGLTLFVYGLIVFADIGAGQLIRNGVGGYVVSPYIWDSSASWPAAGFEAAQGLLMALTGFFVLRFKLKESDLSSEISYVWPFLRAFLDTLILFFAWCLTWEVLLSIFEPGAGNLQIIYLLYAVGVSNTFVMNLSAIMLTLLSAFKLRSFLFGWFPLWPTSRRFDLGIGLLSLSLGVAILVIASYFASSLDVLGILTRVRNGFCNEECYFTSTLDLVGAGVGFVFMIVGAIVSTERLFPREPAL